MSFAPNKRAVMGLYCKATDHYCHRVRIVLAEKGVTVDMLDVDQNAQAKQEVQELNPYGSVPTLIDRELVLYPSEIIMEYLDERFPHPPLLPVYPVGRGRTRLMIYRINRDWCSLMDKILKQLSEGESNESILNQLRKELKEGLVSISPIFKEMPFFLSEEFSMIDCCLAPLLWRLPILGIELPPQAKPVLEYADRMFKRESFGKSLTEAEIAMRKQSI